MVAWRTGHQLLSDLRDAHRQGGRKVGNRAPSVARFAMTTGSRDPAGRPKLCMIVDLRSTRRFLQHLALLPVPETGRVRSCSHNPDCQRRGASAVLIEQKAAENPEQMTAQFQSDESTDDRLWGQGWWWWGGGGGLVDEHPPASGLGQCQLRALCSRCAPAQI